MSARLRRSTLRPWALGLLVLGGALLGGCSGDDDVATARPTPSVEIPLPSASIPAVGPRPRTAFDYIREYGVRPGSVDDLLIRDLLTVADAQRAFLDVRGEFGSAEDVQKATGYRLRSGTVAVVSGAGAAAELCLRAFLNEDDPRVWFYDTDRVLPRGESCT